MYSIARVIQLAFNFYSALILVYCILSWFPPQNRSPLVADLRAALDVIVGRFLGVFRGIIPPVGGMDFSPVIAIVALSLIERVVMSILV